MKICKVKGDYIQLNQLLKLENIVSTGGEARQLIEHGMVRVNGEKAEAIRKKIKPLNTFFITRNSENS